MKRISHEEIQRAKLGHVAVYVRGKANVYESDIEVAQAQLEADTEVLDEVIKVVESHQFSMPLPSWWVALKEKC